MGLALALVEASTLFAAVFAAIVFWRPPGVGQELDTLHAMGQALALSLCYLIAFYFNDLYDLRIVRSFREFAPRLIQSIGIAFILVTPFYTFLPNTRISEQPFALSLFIIVALVVAVRATSYGMMRSRPFIERVLLLGAGPLAEKLIHEIESQPHRRYTIVGVADDAKAGEERPTRYPVLGPLARLDKIIHEIQPDRIIVSMRERRGRLPVTQLLESRVRGVRVEDGIEAYEHLTGKLAIESLTPSALVFSEDFRNSRIVLALGRAVSVLVSLVGLVIMAPLFALIALAIKLDSRGPVFFIHERVGLGGRLVRLIKFRTMRPTDCPTSEWAGDNNDRITRVGKWLRECRLDEVPQFVNILRGDMNLVGPRPHPVSNVELFGERIPYYSLRGLVRPGVTGWAQIRYGYANNLDEETEKMRYDLYYIKHLSIGLDLRILFETVKIILFGRERRDT